MSILGVIPAAGKGDRWGGYCKRDITNKRDNVFLRLELLNP